MATRQYKGARYVPIFGRIGDESIEWDSAKEYEPLTIVLHEGNSYTSRQFVPIGVAITNQDFWALTGNYNAQVESLKYRVIDVEENKLDKQPGSNKVYINNSAGETSSINYSIESSSNTIVLRDENGNVSTGSAASNSDCVNLEFLLNKIVDNLTSDDATKILSAKQGKKLKELIDGCYYKKKLWTNPNATGAFNPATITLDLTNYDAIQVFCARKNTESSRLRDFTILPGKIAPADINYQSKMHTRLIEFLSAKTGVKIYDAVTSDNYGIAGGTTDNTLIIPEIIYGIKNIK